MPHIQTTLSNKITMNTKKLLLFLLLIVPLIFSSCDKDDEDTTPEIPKTLATGFAQKGPFATGSKVTITELDDKLKATGKTFETTTNNEGYYELQNSAEFGTKYVRLSVNGRYFNEWTGELSQTAITIEAITDIKQGEKVNINLLTHLEIPRIEYLVNEGNMSFSEAKKQAEEELLHCFLISDQVITPENMDITANNTEANILIAISAILLRDNTEVQFAEIVEYFRQDMKDGQISEEMKEEIHYSSFWLDHNKVRDNIVNHYKNIGKEVSVGNFYCFIDGDSDGQLSEVDYLAPTTIDDIFDKEEKIIEIMHSSAESMRNNIENLFLLEALYSNSIDKDKLNNYYSLIEIYDHQLYSYNSRINDLWAAFYRIIRLENILISGLADKDKEEFKKYSYSAKVFRAYNYINMVELWGDVPFVIKELSIEDSYDISRNPTNEILDYLIKDLKEAINYLPQKTEDVICSRHFANALLAKIYAYKKDYANAILYSGEVIASGQFNLSSDYNRIFNEDTAEPLFYLSQRNPESSYRNPYFEELIKKGSLLPLVRYSEIILINSEAYFNANRYQEAINSLNTLRQRNNHSLLPGNASQEEIQKALLEEWKTDLAKEGTWFSTLKRFGISEETLNIPSFRNLLPIPETEIMLCPGMKQNPGYGHF